MRAQARASAPRILLITHDLGVVAEIADRVVVMYAGREVEQAPVARSFARPRHPYTRGLLGSVPKLGSPRRRDASARQIPGVVPSLLGASPGCAFAAAAPSDRRAAAVAPALEAKAAGHCAACHFAGEGARWPHDARRCSRSTT